MSYYNPNLYFLPLLKWTPTGRRLITGSQSGEFTLWNGQSFNFEMILQVNKNIISISWHKIICAFKLFITDARGTTLNNIFTQ